MPADEQTVDDAKRKIRHACGRYVIGKIDGDQMIGEITAVILAISPNEMNKFADWISRATEL